MDRIDPTKKQKLLEYKKKAIDHKTDKRFLSEKEIVILLVKALPVTPSLVLTEELKQGLRNSPLFIALADWCDPDNGLGKLFPDQILQVAEYFFALEK